jgi:hypothetical protein
MRKARREIRTAGGDESGPDLEPLTE